MGDVYKESYWEQGQRMARERKEQEEREALEKMKPKIKDKILAYFNLADEIHQYFGYKEDWVTIPMDNQLNSYWLLTDRSLAYSDQPLTEESVFEGKKIYSAKIYTQRFLPKWVYQTEELTLVCADTQCDGNKYLMIFDNAKECKDVKLKKLFENKWGMI